MAKVQGEEQGIVQHLNLVFLPTTEQMEGLSVDFFAPTLNFYFCQNHLNTFSFSL